MHRRWAGASAVAGVAIGAVLAVSVLSVPGLFAQHTLCRTLGQVQPTIRAWVPLVLMNSPYRGSVNGGTAQSQMITPATNGAAYWMGDLENITIYATENVTIEGSGPSLPCNTMFQVHLTDQGYSAAGFPIMGPGNTSDASEPHLIDLNSTPFNASRSGVTNSIRFNNSFAKATGGLLSTCSGALDLNVTAQRLTLSVVFARQGVNYSVLFDVPDDLQYFHYWFPANGTWAVDNLSMEGGPGGGLAFDYLGPCT